MSHIHGQEGQRMTATLGSLIRQRRHELGLTQEQLAERVGHGVRQAEISRLERDRIALPRRARLEQIARALELPVGVLLARSGWAGADEALNVAPRVAVPERREGPRTAASAGPSPAAVARPGTSQVPCLVEALSRAQDLTLRTREAIKHARETFERAQQVHRKRARRAADALHLQRP